MYARLSTYVDLRSVPEPHSPYEIEEDAVLEGEVTDEIILAFLRQLFVDEIIHPIGARNQGMRSVRRIVIDFRKQGP